MPLTAFQKDVLAVLAANRSEESHFAGGVLLHASDDSSRFSRDFDIFHDVALEVVRASERDVASLRDAGFTVDTISRHGEWERDTTFRRAIVRGRPAPWWRSTGPRIPPSGSFPSSAMRSSAGVCICSTRPRTRR
jgi:hypothetical protein